MTSLPSLLLLLCQAAASPSLPCRWPHWHQPPTPSSLLRACTQEGLLTMAVPEDVPQARRGTRAALLVHQ